MAQIDTISQKGEAVYLQNNLEGSAVDNDTFSHDLSEADDFSPGLFFLTLFALVFLLACMGAGIVITILLLLLLFGLVSAGILSTSLIIGFHQRSLAAGFKTFVMLYFATGGTLLGGATLGILNYFCHWWPATTAITAGFISGLIAGIALGFITLLLIQRVVTFLKERLKLV